jgi:signal transduction histidine kinase
MVVFSDVTAVERQRRELQRHDEQLDGVADAVTHELRNTVTIIRGHVSGAASAIDDGDATAARERLRTVSEAADRTGRIVNDLVTLAEYGQTVEDTTALDLPSVVERARRATDAGVNVSADDAVLEGAPDRVQALFENAIRFASHNGATTVTVGVGESEITIEDDGRSPFDDSDPERFFSYGDAVPNAEAGLTLPNVRSLARVHGWSTTVDTTYRGGTRIVVSGVDVHDGAA